MTHDTEIPTLTDIEDSKKAMDDIQSFTYPIGLSFIDSKNVSRITTKGLEAQYIQTAINDGVWAAGQTFTAYNQYMVFSGTAYKPKNSTTLPYIVGATPVGDNNVEVVGNLSTAQGDQRYDKSQILADAISDLSLQLGQRLRITDRGNALFNVVLASGVTPNIFNPVQCTGLTTFALELDRTDVFYALEWGADNIDNSPVLDTMLAAAGGTIPIEFPPGISPFSSLSTMTEHGTEIRGAGRKLTFFAISAPFLDSSGVTNSSLHGFTIISTDPVLTNYAITQVNPFNAEWYSLGFDGVSGANFAHLTSAFWGNAHDIWVNGYNIGSTDPATWEVTGFYLDNCNAFFMSQCHFFRMKQPMIFDSCQGSSVLQSSFEHYDNAAIKFITDSNMNAVDFCRFETHFDYVSDNNNAPYQGMQGDNCAVLFDVNTQGNTYGSGNSADNGFTGNDQDFKGYPNSKHYIDKSNANKGTSARLNASTAVIELTNLIENSNFDSWKNSSDPLNWFKETVGYVSSARIDTTDGVSFGAYGLKIVGDGNFGGFQSSSFRGADGQTIHLKTRVKWGELGGTFRISIWNLTDSVYADLNTLPGANHSNTPTEWQEIHETALLPAGSTGKDLVVWIGWTNAGGSNEATIYIDTLKVGLSDTHYRGAKYIFLDKPNDPLGGGTTERPVFTSRFGVGTSYFDVTLGKSIWWDGTNWVDATGTTV